MSYRLKQDGDVLRIEFYGTFVNQDLWRGGDEVDRIERVATVVPHRISDLRPVERLEIDFNGVFELALARRQVVFKNPFKSAIIVTDIARYGFARMYQTLNDHHQIVLAIFGDEETAWKWIRVPGLAPPEGEWRPSPPGA